MTPGYAIGAGCFLLLAGFRLSEGSWVWALVFTVAAACQVYLGLRAAPATAPRPTAAATDREQRTWRLLAVSSCGLTAGLLVLQPALSPIAAATGLYCLWRLTHRRPA
ncbi:hypothetical protein QFW96_16845 [Saccharopolyspora sp. TS4A08]|uniref:Integral membrane protein n=1 Tax=Saccharopolyspora ipomoeae TaxID=3042027 RepID=A0ABT6PR51_9PSEU|nr:hypothetical protein [Saccharopolyspora sp. TS4A08]MDI2030300.1 hypothetical protein [Saccharopolyspora sp. TS4A08]